MRLDGVCWRAGICEMVWGIAFRSCAGTKQSVIPKEVNIRDSVLRGMRLRAAQIRMAALN